MARRMTKAVSNIGFIKLSLPAVDVEVIGVDLDLVAVRVLGSLISVQRHFRPLVHQDTVPL